jgi:hypothetical protein
MIVWQFVSKWMIKSLETVLWNKEYDLKWAQGAVGIYIPIAENRFFEYSLFSQKKSIWKYSYPANKRGGWCKYEIS